MKSISHPKSQAPQERGVALIITLSILAMLTILLVAFVNNVRVERISAKASTDQLKSKLAAEAAVQQAIFDLRLLTQSSSFITVVSNSVQGSLTNPVTYFVTNGVAWIDGRTYDYVHSTAALSSSNDFNAGGVIYPTNLVPRMPIAWVYYTNSFAVTNNTAVQPILAIRGMTRFAYWIDDESSKININYAGNTNGASSAHVRSNVFSASAIDLRGLTGVTAVIAQDIVTGRAVIPYETLATLASLSGITYTNLFINGMSVFATAQSTDYERQSNGVKRLFLNSANYATTNATVAVTNLVQDIGSRIPSYTNKFGSTIYQLAANIRDQLDTDLLPTDSETDPYSTNGYLGIEAVPYLNEFTLDSSVNASRVGANYSISVTNRVIWELFHPWKSTYTFASNALSARSASSVALTWMPSGSTNLTSSNLTVGITSGSIAPMACIVRTNSYGFQFNIPTNPPPTPLSITAPASGVISNLWGVTNSGIYYRLDLARLPSRAAWTTSIVLSSGMALTTRSNFHHFVVAAPGDPRINTETNHWTATTVQSFGQTNALYQPNVAGGDGNDAADLLTDGGLPFVNGAFPSPGFLGNVSYPTNSWQTLKIYRDGYSNFNTSARVPDGVLLDLFTTNTPGAPVQGKININTQRDLLTATGARKGSLFGLLSGISVSPTASLSTNGGTDVLALATNITANMPYFSISEIGAKATLLSSNLTGFSQTTDERREAILRALSGITTVRGNEFTIWGIGQSIQIVPGRGTNVMGEAVIQALVERTELFDATQVTGQTYRIKYYRFITE